MGDPKKTKKHYETPRKPWDKGRLDSERGLVKKYGLKSKRELWRVETILRKKRENARKLLALPLEKRLKREKDLLGSLARLGLLSGNSTLDDVLTLPIDSLLERRLQTMVLRQGLANTAKQARQFIAHGNIAVNGKRVDAPGCLVTVDEEKKISYYGKPMQLKPTEPKKDLKKEFEEAVGKEAAAEETVGAKVEDAKGKGKKKVAKKKEESEGENAAEEEKGEKVKENG